MSNSEFTIALICCLFIVGHSAFLDYRCYTRRFKELSERIDKLVLRIETLEMECGKLEK